MTFWFLSRPAPAALLGFLLSASGAWAEPVTGPAMQGLLEGCLSWMVEGEIPAATPKITERSTHGDIELASAPLDTELVERAFVSFVSVDGAPKSCVVNASVSRTHEVEDRRAVAEAQQLGETWLAAARTSGTWEPDPKWPERMLRRCVGDTWMSVNLKEASEFSYRVGFVMGKQGCAQS